jgi:predicted N-formylglutamate amidohydrolase
LPALTECRSIARMNPIEDAVKPCRVLADDEPAPFRVENADGASPFVVICDHAGRRIPRSLGTLGLPAGELERHIAWDIGALGVASHLSALLDATLIAQTYSRLVIDCNRPLDAPTSIAICSERTDIPGNRSLRPEEAQARADEIFLPYHERIAAELDRRQAFGQAVVLVSMHSFTPVYMDAARPWQIGMLYHRDARLARAMLARIRSEGVWTAGDNEPYSVSDGSDYAIPVHAERRGIAHVEIEVRQDLVTDAHGQREWAERIAGWLRGSMADIA